MAACLVFFALGPLLSQPHNPQPASWVAVATGPPQRLTLQVTFDRVMDNSTNEITESLYVVKINDVSTPLFQTAWNLGSDTVFDFVVEQTAAPGDVISVQLRYIDPLLHDAVGVEVLGFGPISATYSLSGFTNPETPGAKFYK